MKVVIAGVGEVGHHVVVTLYREGVDIIAVDSNPHVLEQLREEVNITTYAGNATDSGFLESVGIARTDLFLAVTNHDETNIIACMMAAEAGVPRKIARVKSIDFGQDHSVNDQNYLGIDLIINPYEVTAEHLVNLVLHPDVTDYNLFLSDQVLLVRFFISVDSPLAGETVLSFGQAGIPQTLIALIQRKGGSFIPDREEVIQPGDSVYFFCGTTQYTRLSNHLGFHSRPTKKVLINGGGNVGYAVARRLERLVPDVRIIEISDPRCNMLSGRLDDTLVLNVDGTDAKKLKSEGVESMDCFLSVTNSDQANIVSSMMARQQGTSRTIALIKQPELLPMLRENRVVDVPVCPRLITARKILRFVRGVDLLSFFAFSNSDIEVLELQVKPDVACLDTPLSKFNLPQGVLVGAVKRGGDIFIPRGPDSLYVGDRILVIQQRRHRKISNGFFLEPKSPPPVIPEEHPSHPF